MKVYIGEKGMDIGRKGQLGKRKKRTREDANWGVRKRESEERERERGGSL